MCIYFLRRICIIGFKYFVQFQVTFSFVFHVCDWYVPLIQTHVAPLDWRGANWFLAFFPSSVIRLSFYSHWDLIHTAPVKDWSLPMSLPVARREGSVYNFQRLQIHRRWISTTTSSSFQPRFLPPRSIARTFHECIHDARRVTDEREFIF